MRKKRNRPKKELAVHRTEISVNLNLLSEPDLDHPMFTMMPDVKYTGPRVQYKNRMRYIDGRCRDILTAILPESVLAECSATSQLPFQIGIRADGKGLVRVRARWPETLGMMAIVHHDDLDDARVMQKLRGSESPPDRYIDDRRLFALVRCGLDPAGKEPFPAPYWEGTPWDGMHVLEPKKFVRFVAELILVITRWPRVEEMRGGIGHIIGDHKWRKALDFVAGKPVTETIR